MKNLTPSPECLVSTNLVPAITSFEVQSGSIMLSWVVPAVSIIDNYTVTVTRLCESIVLSPVSGIAGNLTELSIDVSGGFEYSVSIVPINLLGEGKAKTDNVTVESNGKLSPDTVCC